MTRFVTSSRVSSVSSAMYRLGAETYLHHHLVGARRSLSRLDRMGDLRLFRPGVSEVGVGNIHPVLPVISRGYRRLGRCPLLMFRTAPLQTD
jgi:hypothetical protein